MDLPNDEVGCDFCAHTTQEWGRCLYECDQCHADVCSECSSDEDETDGRLLCKACDPTRGAP